MTQTFSSRLAVLILITTTLFPAQIYASNSAFSPLGIEKEIADYYLNSTTSDPVELQDRGLIIVDEIALLDVASFNDIMGHISADYYHHPEHRLTLEQIVALFAYNTPTDDPSADEVRKKLREELVANHESNAITTILDKVTLAFAVAFAFEFGKGLWESRGSGLEGLAKWENAKEMVSKNVSEVMRGGKTRTGVLIIGGAVGIGQAISDSIRKYKQDPAHLLDNVQYSILTDLGKKADAFQKESKTMSQEPASLLKAHMEGYQARQSAMIKDLEDVDSQLQHLCAVRADYNSRGGDIRADIDATRTHLTILNKNLQLLVLMGSSGRLR